MADREGGGSTGIVAIVVIFVIVLLLGFLAFNSGFFGGGSRKTEIDVNLPSGGGGSR